MGIRTHRVATVAALALMSACASAPLQPSASSPSSAELSKLRAQQLEQTQRITELEARLALLEADARHARDGNAAPLRPSESVRIGGNVELASHVSTTVDAPAADGDDDGKRPTLRLYGNGNAGGAAGSSTTPRASLPPVPTVNERLPVVPLPEQRAAKVLRAGSADTSDGAVEQYRTALRSLRERRYDDAVTQFAAFLADHARHELAASALYWRGEALYAKRDYGAASRELEAFIDRYPAAPRAPDALLKLGMSLRKLGAADRAEAAFQRLRTDYPKSQAAEVAAREGST
jgi:tol-pal system protein YbgF